MASWLSPQLTWGLACIEMQSMALCFTESLWATADRGLVHVQVLMVRDGMAIVEGLKNDAPIGTELAFVSGASGCVSQQGFALLYCTVNLPNVGWYAGVDGF